ncbi:MAG: aminoacyl-tRNA hydrolase [Candidatus Vogelbacteria bacterium]|nr:aminoacyl-tRNA hydrolase [Candidatus Vogelbacteria bacterium]
MSYVIVGLGNPGKEYEKTRHNTGRMVVARAAEKFKGKAKILVPDTFMNQSGKAVAKVVKSKKAAAKLVVVYDDLDLPLGTFKISFNRSSGGHRGLESIIKTLKTKEFIRVRVGIAPKKKLKTEKQVLDYILGEFRKPELEILKKTSKKVAVALETIVTEGKDRAMNLFN